MKKIYYVPIFILGIFVFLSSSNFRLSNDDSHNVQRGLVFPLDSNGMMQPHDAHTDYNPNLVIPPYVYYPPTKDNALLYTNINVSNNSPAPQNEPAIKISHKNPNRVVAGWRDFRINYNPAYRRVGYSYSTDGGASWAPSALLDSTILGGNLLRNSDASVTVDSAGNFYITTIALNNSNGNTTLAIYKSTDGGVTFPIASTLYAGSSEDKEMITTDLSPGSPFYNRLYISWSRLSLGADIKVIRSTDMGGTWSSPANVSSNGTGQGSDPAVGANGEVYVVWVNANTWGTQYFSKSTDGGVTFSTQTVFASGNAGNIPWSQSGPTTFPAVACDISGGPRNGNIYVVWGDGRNGDEDVFLERSTDRGSTWSSPVRINNDGIGNGKVQAWPWIAVNQNGLISVVFYDTRNTSSNNNIECWVARSSDGGVTFTNEVLSTQQSPTNQPNTDVRFGDYIGVDFWTNKIIPVWTDERAGGFDMEIYSANYDITGQGPILTSIPKSYELQQNYPNPFNPNTTISFNLPKATNINLSIYDVNGQLVYKLIDGMVSSGFHKVNWDASNYSSGVYFY
ncbi:MAG: T9SS type A sorting domain-containing protein, partial [Ignavibacteria bacterium]